MVDSKNLFDHLVKSYTKSHKNNRKITIGQGDDYTAGSLLGYPYFEEN